MKIRQIFRWIELGALIEGLAFTSMSLPGRTRVSMPMYGKDDLLQEFRKSKLPDDVVNCFENAVRAQRAGDFRLALNLYFKLDGVRWDNGYVNMAEGSAVVVYNIYLIYKYVKKEDVARIYLERYKELQFEADKS